ncbi:hypothetical protein FA95DRAFT_1584187 [Auriscalpium vulgare]|uniref:Uncharacterized protein n=1 Tax=Auriscalpium vulgare TaxID=40419 RepID=A0ACB8RI62_9AGAM|nr:hypothetical protein FA95DRAFT_1584187 [Auriscalpium vulgare]
MTLLLPAIISNTSRPHHPFVVIESSACQSGLSIVRAILNRDKSTGLVLLFCFLYLPSSLVHDPEREGLRVFDRTGVIPGFSENWKDPSDSITQAVKDAPLGPLSVIIDSADTLCADLGSTSKSYTLISSLVSLLRDRPSHTILNHPASRLVLHLVSPTPLLPLLLPPRLSPALTHLTAHPPALLTHLASAHLTPPPPATPPARFFRVFTPLAARAWEVERLVFGADGSGGGGGEAVVEVLVRAAVVGEKRRGVVRVLEGWSRTKGPVALDALESLRGVWTRKTAEESAADPTQHLSFNLNLTPQQQQSRAQVPLPYAHEGEASNQISSTAGVILYDPDSADDIDDDDPDEDLDI